MKYSEKLKDPRWQKKRLEILNRDNFTCQICKDTKSTLHVHHRKYLQNTDPWDYSNELLITLCEDCHEYEREVRPKYERDLLDILKEKFFSDDLYYLIEGFLTLKIIENSTITAIHIKLALINLRKWDEVK